MNPCVCEWHTHTLSLAGIMPFLISKKQNNYYFCPWKSQLWANVNILSSYKCHLLFIEHQTIKQRVCTILGSICMWETKYSRCGSNWKKNMFWSIRYALRHAQLTVIHSFPPRTLLYVATAAHTVCSANARKSYKKTRVTLISFPWNLMNVSRTTCNTRYTTEWSHSSPPYLTIVSTSSVRRQQCNRAIYFTQKPCSARTQHKWNLYDVCVDRSRMFHGIEI